MVKFTTYDAPTQVASGVGGRAASPADFGSEIGAAAQQFGNSLDGISELLKVRQEKRDVTAAHAAFSDFKVQRKRDTGQAMQDAGIGAPNIFDEQVVAFDDAYATHTQNMTEGQKQALAPYAATFRTNMLSQVNTFQAQEIVKADVGNMRAIAKGMGGELHEGFRDLASAEADFRTILEATTLGDPAKEALVLEQLPIWRANLTNGLLENVAEGAAVLQSGALDGDFTPEELALFRKEIIKRMNGSAQEALNNKMFEFMVNHNEAYDAVISGGVNSLEDFESYRGKVSNEVFNYLRDIIIDRVVPKLPESEIQDGEANALADFYALGITKDDSKADLEDILRFQNKMTILAAKGEISNTSRRRYFRQSEKRVQQLIDESGVGALEFDTFLHTIDPFDRAADTIHRRAKIEKWDAGRISRTFRELIVAADAYDKIPQDHADKKAAGEQLAILAFDEEQRNANPALRHIQEVPDGFVMPSGQILMASGSGAAKMRPTVPRIPITPIREKVDPNTGKTRYWTEVLDDTGKPTGETVEQFLIGLQPNGDPAFSPVRPITAGETLAPAPTDIITVETLPPPPPGVFIPPEGVVIPVDVAIPGWVDGGRLFFSEESGGSYYYQNTPGGTKIGLPEKAALLMLKGAGLGNDALNGGAGNDTLTVVPPARFPASSERPSGVSRAKPEDVDFERVWNNIRQNEGEGGDINLDGTPNTAQGGTNEYGMTTAKYNELKARMVERGDLKAGDPFSYEDAAKMYIKEIYDGLNSMEGANKLSAEVKELLIDLEYNTSTLQNGATWGRNLKNNDGSPTLAGLIANGAPEWQILLKTLEFIIQKQGKISYINSGLANRRAKEYNTAALDGDKITQIHTTKTAENEWTVEFKRVDGEIVYTRKGPLHENSKTRGDEILYPKIGSVNIQNIVDGVDG